MLTDFALVNCRCHVFKSREPSVFDFVLMFCLKNHQFCPSCPQQPLDLCSSGFRTHSLLFLQKTSWIRKPKKAGSFDQPKLTISSSQNTSQHLRIMSSFDLARNQKPQSAARLEYLFVTEMGPISFLCVSSPHRTATCFHSYYSPIGFAHSLFGKKGNNCKHHFSTICPSYMVRFQCSQATTSDFIGRQHASVSFLPDILSFPDMRTTTHFQIKNGL